MLKQILQVAQEIESVFERSQALTHIVQAYARVGQFDSALTIIETIEDPYKKVDALARLAEAYSKAGVQDKAFEMLEQAVQVTPEPGMSTMEIRQISLCLIAKTYVAIGEYSQAIQVVQNYSYIRDEPYPLIRYDLFLDPSKRSELLELAQARNVQQITRILQVGDDEITCEHQVVALAEVAGECANGEQFEFAMQALRVADSIEFGKESRAKAFKLNALSKIAVKYAEIGQFDLAIHTLEKINAPSWKGSTLCKIACKFAEAGQYERAFELVEMIEHRERKEEGLDNLAKIYAEAGQYNRALQTAKLIKDVELKHSAITKVVEKYVEFGHYDRAFKIVKKSRRNDFKANFLWILAKGLTKNEISNQNPENLSQLLQCSLSIKNNGVNGSDIVSLAIKIVIIEQCIRIIKSDKATEVLSQAIAQIEILKSPTEKNYALTNLATRYLELGYKTNALTALYQILNIIDDRKLLSDKTLSSKADTLMVIASLLVEAGECEQALQIIEKIEISDQFSWSRQGYAMSKCMALFDVAKKYAELNQKDKTVEILSKILQVSDLDDSYKAAHIDAVAKIYFSLEFPSRV